MSREPIDQQIANMYAHIPQDDLFTSGDEPETGAGDDNNQLPKHLHP